MTIQVLLIEDANLDQSKSLLTSLEDQGYQVSMSHTPETALETTRVLWPNLIVFNSNKSLLNLLTLQTAINQFNLKIPYVVVGDKSDLTTETSGNIIMVAPDKLQQLSQSLKKVTANQQNRFVRLPDLIIDCHQRQLLCGGQIYSLTPKEFRLLFLLINYADQILSRKTIMQEVWETDYLGDTRTLDVHIRWIREKIEKNPSRPQRLITIRGVGYRFVANPE
jgi:DNA-binding response OmpR family regulator